MADDDDMIVSYTPLGAAPRGGAVPRVAGQVPTGVPGLTMTPQVILDLVAGLGRGVGQQVAGLGAGAAQLPGIQQLSTALAPPGMTGVDAIRAAQAGLGSAQSPAEQVGEVGAYLAPALLTPVGGVMGEALTGGALAQAQGGNPVTGALMGGGVRAGLAAKPLAAWLQRSARETLGKALHPTMQRTKAIVRRRTPEWLHDPAMRGSLEGMHERAVQEEAHAGRAVGQLWATHGQTPLDIAPIVRQIERLKRRKTMTSPDGQTLSMSGLPKHLDRFADTLRAAGTRTLPDGSVVAVPAKAGDLLKLRRELDEMVDAVGGFNAKGGREFGDLYSQTTAWAAREVRRILAKEFAKAIPDLDEVNKAFAAAADKRQVLEHTLGRRTGQHRTVEHLLTLGAGAVAGGATEYATGDPEKALATALGASAMAFMRSPAFRTVSAQARQRLADHLAAGRVGAAQRLLGRLMGQGAAQATGATP